MSKGIDIADAMVARINALPDFDNVEAMVWRQKNIESELAQKTGRSTGALIVVVYAGFTNPDSSASVHATVTRRYVASVFSKPVLRNRTATAADDIVETVARSLHNWEPDETTTGAVEIRVASCEVRPDAEYLIYDMEIECVSRL